MTVNRAAKTVETFNIVVGLTLNSLLLFLITRRSKPHLGNYKNLLKLFACNDIFLLTLHWIVEPATFSSGSALGLFSQAFPDNVYSISLCCACFTIPFTLMVINFLHRFWAVRNPQRVILFSKPSFIALLSVYPLTVTTLWFIFCLQVDNDPIGKAIVLPALILSGNEENMGEGWLFLYLWDGDHWNTEGLTLIAIEGVIMTTNVSIATVLCILTIHRLRDAKNFSPSYRTMQIKVLQALFAQSIVPLVLVNVPYGLAISMPFISNDDEKGRFDPWFTLLSSFPVWDAVVIMALMKDYREALISLILNPDNLATVQTTTHHTTSLAQTKS